MFRHAAVTALIVSVLLIAPPVCLGLSEAFKGNVYDPGQLKPVDSQLKVRVGDEAPDFTLPSTSGVRVTLSDYRGKKNVVISFVPASNSRRQR